MRCEITSGFSKSCSKSTRGVLGKNQSLVAPTALYSQSCTATVADHATWCSYVQGLTGRMAAGTSAASEMETNGALRSAQQKKQSAINDTTIFASNYTPPPMSWDILHDLDLSTSLLAVPVPALLTPQLYYKTRSLLPSTIIRLSSLRLSNRSSPNNFPFRSRRHSYSLILLCQLKVADE